MSTLRGDSDRDHPDREGDQPTPGASIHAELPAGTPACEVVLASATNAALPDRSTVGARLLRGNSRDQIAAWHQRASISRTLPA